MDLTKKPSVQRHWVFAFSPAFIDFERGILYYGFMLKMAYTGGNREVEKIWYPLKNIGSFLWRLSL